MEIFDDRLQFVPVAAALAIGDTLPTGDVHLEELVQAAAFELAGGPMPPAWPDLGLLRLVGASRALSWGCRRPASAAEMQMFWDCSLHLCLWRIGRHRFTLSEGLELTAPWGFVSFRVARWTLWLGIIWLQGPPLE